MNSSVPILAVALLLVLAEILLQNRRINRIMKELDDLKREVTETKAAVLQVTTTLAETVTRVSAIVEQLKGAPTPAELATLAADLDAEQIKLNAINAALADLGKPAEPSAG